MNSEYFSVSKYIVFLWMYEHTSDLANSRGAYHRYLMELTLSSSRIHIWIILGIFLEYSQVTLGSLVEYMQPLGQGTLPMWPSQMQPKSWLESMRTSNSDILRH